MLARMIAVVVVLFLVPSLALDVAPPLRAEIITRPPPPVEVRVRPGVTIKYLALRPKTEPRNAVILFAGGNGLLNLQPNGSIGTNLSGNFLVRSRDRFVLRNLFVAVVDTPKPSRDQRQCPALGAVCAGHRSRDRGCPHPHRRRRQGLAGRHQFGNAVGSGRCCLDNTQFATDPRQCSPAGWHRPHRDPVDPGQGLVWPDGLQRSTAGHRRAGAGCPPPGRPVSVQPAQICQQGGRRAHRRARQGAQDILWWPATQVPGSMPGVYAARFLRHRGPSGGGDRRFYPEALSGAGAARTHARSLSSVTPSSSAQWTQQ